MKGTKTNPLPQNIRYLLLESQKIDLDSRGKGSRARRLWKESLAGYDLRCIDLYGTDLSYADLSGSDLRGANLKNTQLYQANLSGALL